MTFKCVIVSQNDTKCWQQNVAHGEVAVRLLPSYLAYDLCFHRTAHVQMWDPAPVSVQLLLEDPKI